MLELSRAPFSSVINSEYSELRPSPHPSVCMCVWDERIAPPPPKHCHFEAHRISSVKETRYWFILCFSQVLTLTSQFDSRHRRATGSFPPNVQKVRPCSHTHCVTGRNNEEMMHTKTKLNGGELLLAPFGLIYLSLRSVVPTLTMHRESQRCQAGTAHRCDWKWLSTAWSQ